MLIGKNKRKVGKKALCLIFAFLLSINSFAAVVSDNDGSAFVTKAEFEGLKKDFNDQITNYNSSIDNKIDGAIASYLAGIKLNKKLYYKVIPTTLTTDKYVNFMNGYLKPEFRLPRLNYDFNVHLFKNSADFDGQVRLWMIYGDYNIRYNPDWGTNETNKKPLIKLINGTEDAYGDFYWDGIAIRYNESIVISSLKRVKTTIWPGSIDNTTLTHYISMLNPFTFDQYTGANIKTQNVLTNLRVKYNNSAGQNYTFTSWDKQQSFVSLAVSIDSLDGKTRDHEVLSQYDGATEWDCYNNDFVNHLKTSGFQTKTATNMKDTVHTSTYKTENGHLFSANKHQAATYWHYKSPTWQVSDSSTLLPSVGYVGLKAANSIYQVKNDVKATYRDKDWKISPLTLQEGTPVLAAKQSDNIEWAIKFDHVYCFNEAPNADGTNYDDNQNEVDIYLSYKPFTNLVTTGSADLDNENLVEFTQDGTKKKFFTTTNQEGKLEFEMKEDSVIYMKAVPHYDTTATYNGLNDWWDLYLNIDGDNGTFTIIYE